MDCRMMRLAALPAPVCTLAGGSGMSSSQAVSTQTLGFDVAQPLVDVESCPLWTEMERMFVGFAEGAFPSVTG